MSGLHAQIMNLPTNSRYGMGNASDLAYKEGHRDARHAAAELATVIEQQRDELLAALIEIQQVACSGSPELGIATEAIDKSEEKQ